MKIGVMASTKPGHVLPKEEAINFSGLSAGICYLPDTLDTLLAEDPEKTKRRANGNIASGHHSVFGHPTYNLRLEGIPKILAIILNNEKAYTTSEKSARYTKMEPSESEKVLYEKWIEIYKELIAKAYPGFEEKKIKKLAQENARYLISVFTPATVMEYTASFQQLNYIIGWAEAYIKNANDDNIFEQKLKGVLQEFLKEMLGLKVDGLNSRLKRENFSIFAKRSRREEFGENYCVNYLGSFAEFAQAERHRTLKYEMTLLDVPQYYIPPIIRNTPYEAEWLQDISSLAEFYPQGMLVKINERGSLEDFLEWKCTERLCGCAQLEIMEQTKATLNRYLEAVKDIPECYNELLPYSKGARCTFPGWVCNSPCVFGGKKALDRII